MDIDIITAPGTPEKVDNVIINDFDNLPGIQSRSTF